MDIEFYKKIKKILAKDPRYKISAYEFLFQALFYTQRKLNRRGHVTGKELLEGIKEYAVEQFGFLAQTVLEEWGVRRTEDFGEIVFNLVEVGLLKKTEEDSIEDFKGVYNFEEAFKEEHNRRLQEDIKRVISISEYPSKKNNKKI
ncbi:MAG: Minf_1886 family protein [Candidatus Omnitrophota bacterium]